MMSTTRITHLSLPLISLVRAHELAVQSVLEPASRDCADLRPASPKRHPARAGLGVLESISTGSELNTSNAQKIQHLSRARRARAAARAAPARRPRAAVGGPAAAPGLLHGTKRVWTGRRQVGINRRFFPGRNQPNKLPSTSNMYW